METVFHEISEKVWDCYKAENKKSFSQRIRRLRAAWLPKNTGQGLEKNGNHFP